MFAMYMLLSIALAMPAQLGLSIGLALAVPVATSAPGVAMVADNIAAAIARVSILRFSTVFLLCFSPAGLLRGL
jgi:hypothetical protein